MSEEESTCRTSIFGDKFWVNFYGYLHQLDDEPAIIYGNGDKKWYVNGKLHRVNGKPAYICSDGSKEWRVNGVNITEQVLAWHKTNNIKYPPTTPEEEEELAVLFKLTFG